MGAPPSNLNPPLQRFHWQKPLGKVEREQSKIVFLNDEMIFKWQKTVSDNCRTYNTLPIRWLSKAAFYYFGFLNFGITTGISASKAHEFAHPCSYKMHVFFLCFLWFLVYSLYWELQSNSSHKTCPGEWFRGLAKKFF